MSGYCPALPAAAALLLLGSTPVPAAAQRAGGAIKAARADFADMAQGSYFGVISDSRGSPLGDVRVAVARIGPNRVRVTSDDARLPAFTAELIRATDMLQNAGGSAVFRLDLSRIPRTLTVTVDDASWTGTKTGP